jgi:hypothetical protein
VAPSRRTPYPAPRRFRPPLWVVLLRELRSYLRSYVRLILVCAVLAVLMGFVRLARDGEFRPGLRDAPTQVGLDAPAEVGLDAPAEVDLVVPQPTAPAPVVRTVQLELVAPTAPVVATGPATTAGASGPGTVTVTPVVLDVAGDAHWYGVELAPPPEG